MNTTENTLITTENTLIKRWSPVLEYTSNLIPKLPEEKWDFVSRQFEIYEKLFKNYPRFLKIFIPQVRVMEGNIEYSFGMIDGYICAVVKGNHEGIKMDIGIPLDPERDICGFYIKNYYIAGEDGNWKFV